jgi:hypothetical protein
LTEVFELSRTLDSLGAYSPFRHGANSLYCTTKKRKDLIRKGKKEETAI